jgi:hypothetical protein
MMNKEVGIFLSLRSFQQEKYACVLHCDEAAKIGVHASSSLSCMSQACGLNSSKELLIFGVLPLSGTEQNGGRR